MKTIGLAGISVLMMASLAACSGDDGQEPAQPANDTGVPAETSTDTGTEPIDSGAPDTNVGDASPDAPVVVEAKLTILKLSETNHDRLFGVTYDAAGNIFATGVVGEGTVSGADMDLAMVVVKFKADGSIDTSFGAAGIAKKNVIAKKGGEVARGIVVQSTGKIVIAGSVEHAGATDDRDRDIALVRFNADGTVDTTFGTAGVVILDLADGVLSGTTYIADSHWGLALAPGGDDLIVSGGQKASGRTDTDYAIIKLKADGTRDTTFGTNGVATVDISNRNASARGVTVAADGSIFGGGYWSDADNVTRPAVFKLKPNGTLDTTFGTGGIYNEAVYPAAAEVYKTALQGTSLVTTGYGRASTTESLDILSLRIKSDGTRDLTYGTSGATRVDVNMQTDQSRDLLILPDDRVFLFGAGRSTATNADALVAVLTKDGKLDTTYGTGGVRVWDLGGPNDFFWAGAISPTKTMIALVGVKGAATDGSAGTDDSALLLMPVPK